VLGEDEVAAYSANYPRVAARLAAGLGWAEKSAA
jgi:hypothetical protein